MNRIPIGQYVAIGIVLKYLHTVNAGTHIQGKGHLLDQLTALENQLIQVKLKVTLALCQALFEIRSRLSPETGYLDDANAQQIRIAVGKIEETLLAEASQLDVFSAAETRFTTRDLFDDVSRLLPQGIFPKLHEMSQRDFSEAGKCLVCSRPTASAFHILRATEGELRQLYLHKVKRNRIPEPRNWGPITGSLKERREKLPDELMALLDHIRKSYRNPTQHPEAEYTLDQAQDLFGLCSDAIARMVNYVNK